MLQSMRRLAHKLTRRFQRGQLDLTEAQLRAAVDLPFQPLFKPNFDIFLPRCIAIQKLIHLPSNGLSGPVQDDKANAYMFLKNLVTSTSYENPEFSIQNFSGINCPPVVTDAIDSLATFAQHRYCRDARILSYRDFEAALHSSFARRNKAPVVIEQIDWLNQGCFWDANQESSLAHFVCAQNYASLRQLTNTVPALINQHQINLNALSQLKASYHMLSMPQETWSHPGFMSLLIERSLPYARIAISRTPKPYIEWLLLPRNHTLSNLLAEALLEAGAADAIEYLRKL